MMKPVTVPEDLTYVGAFLTFHCGYNCSYCITRHGKLEHRRQMPTVAWIEGLNRLKIDRDRMVPITLQGGEPSAHGGFIEIVRCLRSELYVDILTNLDFDVDRLMDAVPPGRLRRDVPYASIRVSYHPGYSDVNTLLAKVFRLQSCGYSVGVFAVDYPDADLSTIRGLCEKLGMDFRTKEFLGWYEGRLHGTYRHLDAVDGKRKDVECRMTELLIAPDGNLHRCHRDLYTGENSLGNLLDEDLRVEFKFRRCDRYGDCNPCDGKLKNNRFQEFGTCSAEIEEVDE